MQPGNFPRNSYDSPPFAPPFSPHSQSFLRPRGPRFWQPSMRPHWNSSTPTRGWHHDNNLAGDISSPNFCDGQRQSPRGADNSDPHYIPLNSSSGNSSGQESPTCGQRGNGWTPKWKQRRGDNRFTPSPGEGSYNRGQNSGFGRQRGRWRNDMNNSGSPRGWSSSNPGHSANIEDYVPPSCMDDPWAELLGGQQNLTSGQQKQPLAAKT